MKNLLILLLIFIHLISYAQTDWRNGKCITPRGDLHVLVIFVSSEFDAINDILNCGTNQECIDYYYTNSIPTWAQSADSNQTGDKDDFINRNENTINNELVNGQMPYLDEHDFNISSYYKTMSFDKFIVTGDVVSILSQRVLRKLYHH